MVSRLPSTRGRYRKLRITCSLMAAGWPNAGLLSSAQPIPALPTPTYLPTSYPTLLTCPTSPCPSPCPRSLANRQEPCSRVRSTRYAASHLWGLASDTMSDLLLPLGVHNHLPPSISRHHLAATTLASAVTAITSPCSLPPFVPPCLPTSTLLGQLDSR
jgi:hypothetical protein